MFGFLRPYYSWLAVTALSFILILTNQNPQGELFRSRFADILVASAYPVRIFFKGARVWHENQRLHALLATMSLEIAKDLECKSENARLRKMLGYRERTEFNIVAAEVIGISSDPAIHGLMINKGEDDGVLANHSVISLNGVVGRVHRTGAHSALVQLLSDPNLGIAGRLKTTREDGVIHAAGKGLLEFDGVPVSTSVTIGDSIISSGLGGIFPPGLFIGSVREVTPESNGWLWNISVDPGEAYGQLEDVFVIRGVAGGK